MAILIDTNVAIAVLNESDDHVDSTLAARFAAGTPILLSTLVLFELEFGISNSARPSRNRAKLVDFLSAPFVIAPIEAEDAEHAGEIRAHLRRTGRSIGPYDVLIAAQARRRDAVLVTANLGEFRRVPGLRVESWGG